MGLHRAAQIPFEGANRVALDPGAKSVDHADQLLGIGVSGARQRQEGGARVFETPVLHQVARLFQPVGPRRRRKADRGGKQDRGGKAKRCHAVLLSGLLATTGAAGGAAGAQGISEDDYIVFDPAQARLGQLLFYDKILSGNRNISCGTCHHHAMAGADGVSLGIGQGGVGLGPERVAPDGDHRIRARVPRNAPALWNLGHRDVRALFHDGRVQTTDYPHWDFDTPAGDWLPAGLNSLLAAQALFPMASHAEMAGEHGQNDVAGAVTQRIDRGWPIIARRVRTIPDYGNAFVDAFPDIGRPAQVSIVQIANALAAFIGTEWRSHDTAWDDFVETGAPLPPGAERGRRLFFGRAGCSTCHDGPLFTDHGFHAAGLPSFGPGRTRRFDPIPRDVGRIGVTDRPKDAYRFRTPSLRNVALTAPYGHNGAIPTLRGMIRHMADPAATTRDWTPRQAGLPRVPWLADADFVLRADRHEMARQAAALDLQDVALSDRDVADIEAFLNCLTDRSPFDRPLGRPVAVPSGLPVDQPAISSRP